MGIVQGARGDQTGETRRPQQDGPWWGLPVLLRGSLEAVHFLFRADLQRFDRHAECAAVLDRAKTPDGSILAQSVKLSGISALEVATDLRDTASVEMHDGSA